MTLLRRLAITAVACGQMMFAGRKPEPPVPSALDEFIAQSEQRSEYISHPNVGSLWTPDSRMNDLALDLRARRIDDIVTILVFDQASALAKGTVKSSRSSNARASVDTLLGPRTTGWLPNLAGLSSNSDLDGQGETTRETTLRTTVTARVTHVLPNGLLVVEGSKSVSVNAENQTVQVRGVVRPVDLSTDNSVFSDKLNHLEITVNGKGVIGDVIRRPNFLYRLLLGVLPF